MSLCYNDKWMYKGLSDSYLNEWLYFFFCCCSFEMILKPDANTLNFIFF